MNDPFKQWLDVQKRITQAWSPALPFAAAGSGATRREGELGDLWQKTLAAWAAMAQGGGKGFDAEAVRAIIDPAAWARQGSGGFDAAFGRLTEGPTYATLSDLDRKATKAQQLWVRRNEDIAAYQAVLHAGWQRAFARFMTSLGDAEGAPIKSGRDLLDAWIATANETLLEVHRSKEFLEAQQRITRSSTDYRLQEREIAEAFCETQHIPTRSEVDEMQRTITELRREVRQLRRTLMAPPEEPAPTPEEPAPAKTSATKPRAAAPRVARAAKAKQGGR